MYFYKLRFVLLFILLLSSCSIPGGDKRLKIIKEHNADQFIEKVYKTAYFEIYSLNKISNNKKVTVYIEGDGLFLKYYDARPDKNEWETPTDQDEVRFDMTIKQKSEEDPTQFVELYSIKAWDTTMEDDKITITMR